MTSRWFMLSGKMTNNWQFHSRVVYGSADQSFVDLNDVDDQAGVLIAFGNTGNSINVFALCRCRYIG